MINTGAYLKGLFNSTVALGDSAVVSDAYFEIEGAEELGLLIKQFPWPELSPAGEIEVPMPYGSTRWQPQQVKTAQQGQVSFKETVSGHVAKFMEGIIGKGGRFNATVYDGNKETPNRTIKIYDCFFQADPVDRDHENRSQIVLISGSLFYHFFGSEA